MLKCKHLMLLTALLCLLCIPQAMAATEGDYTYSVVNEGAKITAYSGEFGATLEIPATLGGYPVTQIGESVFQSKITTECTVIMPDTITTIGKYCFRMCSGLVGVELSDSLTEIPNYAFSETGLKSVVIPDQVTAIRLFAFNNCDALESVTLGAGMKILGQQAFQGCDSLTAFHMNEGLEEIADWAVSDCPKLTGHLQLPSTIVTVGMTPFRNAGYTEATMPLDFLGALPTGVEKLTVTGSGVLPASKLTGRVLKEVVLEEVTEIGKSAFADCTSLTSITLPETLTTIGESAFEDCTSLAAVILPESLTTLDKYAFQRCEALTSVAIPDGITALPYGVFSGCSSLTAATLPENIQSIAYNTLAGTALTEFTVPLAVLQACDYNASETLFRGSSTSNFRLPTSVQKIVVTGTGALPGAVFAGATNLTSVRMEGCTEVGNSAFSGCTGLTELVLPETVTSIGTSAFSGAGIAFPNGLPSGLVTLGSSAFSNCAGLSGKLVLPAGLTSIPQSAFAGTDVTEVVIPDSVTSIGQYAFKGCAELTTVTIGSGVTEIGKNVFQDCPKLKTVNFSEGLTTIGEGAFIDCTALEALKLPNTLTTIGREAFKGCTGITGTLVLPESDLTLTSYAFSGCTGITCIDFTTGKKSIGTYAFENCTGLTGDLTIPANVSDVGQGAFTGCSGLNGTLTIESSETKVYDPAHTSYRPAFSGCDFVKVIAPGTVFTGYAENMYKQILGYALMGKGPQAEFVITGDKLVIDSFYNADNVVGVTLDERITEIPANTFAGMDASFALSMPGVTKLGGSAFASSEGLTELDMPKVDTILANAFKNCINLQKLTFGADVTTVGENAFSGCTTLTEITAKASNLANGLVPAMEGAPVTTVTISAPGTIPANVLGAKDTAVTHIIIEDGVTAIEDNAFAGYTNLKSIVIPDSVTSIGANAFKGCTGLTEIDLPANLATLGNSAFEGCTGLKSVELPETALTLGERLFRDCTALTSAKLPQALTDIPGSMFSNCTALKDFNVPEGVKTIGAAAFYNCDAIQSFTVPAQVTSIESETFRSCDALKTVVLPEGLISIGNRAFEDSMVETINLPDGLESIGDYAFKKLLMHELVLPDSVKEIGKGAFAYSYVNRVTFPAGITTIPEEMFYYGALHELTIPEGVKEIGSCAFYDAVRDYMPVILESVDVAKSVEKLGILAFPTSATCYVYYGSAAHEYAVEENQPYKLKPYSPETIEISLPGEAKLGRKTPLDVKLTPEDLTLDMYAEPQIIFTSSNPEVVSVDESGVVHMLMPGKATITAQDKDDDFVNDTLELTVDDPTVSLPLAFVYVSNSSGSISFRYGVSKGVEPYTIKVTMDDFEETHTDVYIGDKEEVSFSKSLAGPSGKSYTKEVVVTVTDALGHTDTVTGTASASYYSRLVGVGEMCNPVVMVQVSVNGSVQWLPKYTGGYTTETGYSYSSTSDDSRKDLITSITTEESLALKVGNGQWLECRITPSPLNPYDYSSLVFMSDNPAVATVEGEGLITAVSAGQATITVYATDGSGVKATCLVTCVNEFVSSMTITADEVDRETGTQQLHVTVSPENASPYVAWSSSFPDVATVDENGLVTWLKAGEVIITASALDGSYVQKTQVLEWEGVKVEELILSLMPNGQQLTWKVVPAYATDPNVIFQVDDPSVLKVNEAGYLIFLKEGTANVRAVAQDGSKVTATLQVSGSPEHTHIPYPGEIKATPAADGADGALPTMKCVICGAEIGGVVIHASRTITLPAGLTEIEAEAFMGLTQIEQVWIESGVTTIGAQAFAGCPNLMLVHIPGTVTTISKDAFAGCGLVTILCEEGSYAQQFANANGYPYTIK